MIYRVHLYDDENGSAGFEYFTSRRRAEQRLRDWKAESPDSREGADMESAKTPKSRHAVQRLLQRWADHADNG